MHYCITELGQWLKRDYKGQKKSNLFLQQSQNILISFCLYWCMYFIMQNSRSLKEASDFFYKWMAFIAIVWPTRLSLF